jgi:hypothetical protein
MGTAMISQSISTLLGWSSTPSLREEAFMMSAQAPSPWKNLEVASKLTMKKGWKNLWLTFQPL